MFVPGFDFDFLSTSQEIRWEECLRYDLYSVKWEAILNLNTFNQLWRNEFTVVHDTKLPLCKIEVLNFTCDKDMYQMGDLRHLGGHSRSSVISHPLSAFDIPIHP